MHVLLVDALGAGGSALLVSVSGWTVELLLEDGLGLDRLELGFEIFGDVGAGVGSTARIRHGVGEVLDLVSGATPGHGINTRLKVDCIDRAYV